MTRALALALVAMLLAGCVQVAGTFDDIPWSPTVTRFAVADRHTFVEVNGSLQAVQRPDPQKTVTLLFTSAWANPDEEWRRYDIDALHVLRRDLATTDGLLLWDLPASALEPGAELRTHVNTGLADEPRDFSAAVVVSADVALTETSQGLGNALEMTLLVDEADPRAHGFITGSFELKRSRGADQEGEIATGAVTLGFSIPVVAERRGKANLALAVPVMACAAERGPSRAASCVSEAPLSVLDETSTISGIEP